MLGLAAVMAAACGSAGAIEVPQPVVAMDAAPCLSPRRDPSLAGRSGSQRFPQSGGGKKKRAIKRAKRGGKR